MLALLKSFRFGTAAISWVKQINIEEFAVKQKSRKFSSNERKFTNFDEMISNRQSEASRSVIIQVASENSFREVYPYCAQFGNITNAFFYTMPSKSNFILLEYNSLEAVNNTLRASAYNSVETTPVHSRFLWFRKTKQNNTVQSTEIPIELKKMSACREPPAEELANILRNANSMNDQIQLLYENTRLTDLAIRLRYIGALQVQSALSGIVGNGAVYPFGSTINGFGKMGADLDMILSYNNDDAAYNSNKYDDRSLVFQAKTTESESVSSEKCSESEPVLSKREVMQKQIQCFASILDCFLPGLNNILSLHKARTPIVSYFNTYLHLSVDLSVSNMPAFYGSELFHTFGELDSRVRPLIFAVRRWALEFQLTKSGPGSRLTNFNLTCLVLSFLQQLNEPILPTADQLIKQARTEDIRHTEENINCTFLRDLSQIDFKTLNTNSLNELFLQFLEFLVAFDFSARMISLSSTDILPNTDGSPMFVLNPLEAETNCTRSVSREECMGIKIMAQQTIDCLLECNREKSSNNDDRWGMLEIFSHLY